MYYTYNSRHSSIIIRGGIHNFRDQRCHLYSSCRSAMQRWMIVLAYLANQYKISFSWVDVLNLRPFTWSRVSGLIRFQDLSNKATASHFVQVSERVGSRSWHEETSFRRRKHEPCTGSSSSQRSKSRGRRKAKSRARSSFSFK
jgi:hypothetical protein